MNARIRARPLLLILLLAALTRGLYLAFTELPRFDPWRHLLLVANIRAGRGFTLFDGQPYLWHHPAWYHLSAALPAAVGAQWLAGALSLLSVALIWVWVRALRPASPWAAGAAAALAAVFGPLVSFTCHQGPEAFALFLTFAALAVVCTRAGVVAPAVAGALFGLAVAARAQFAFNAVLFVPFVATRRRAAAWAAGAAAPLAAAWWRNHETIAAHPWVFTWDGLATRSADFNVFSTLLIQAHPAVGEGLRRLHRIMAPEHLWLRGPDGVSWGPLLFLLVAGACLFASRRAELALAAGSAAAALLLLDRSLSSHFFRVWLGLFPALIAAVALAADRLRGAAARGRAPALAAGALLALVAASGADELLPQPMYPLAAVTPPPELLQEPAYLVNSTYYHPEALAYRYPDRRFLGLPLDPAQVDEFLRAYPGYRAVLWHNGGVQDDVMRHLVASRGYRAARRGANAFGLGYTVFLPPAGE